MSFYHKLETARPEAAALINSAGEASVLRALGEETVSGTGFAALLSPSAAPLLENMARRANELTLRHFGRTVSLYAPLYLGNYCENECVYCGFRRSSRMKRGKLSYEEAEAEGRALAASGIRHALLLTGESRVQTPVEYIGACAELLKKHFSSLSVEIYPLETGEYARLVEAGADGLTIYQETYDEELYARLHRAGPKRDFRYRLDAPERACRAGMRAVGVGALLGLADFRLEVFCAGLHAAWLQNNYPAVEIGVSLPRFRPQGVGYKSGDRVSDRDLVQAMTALRLFLPRAGITISTREPAELRRNLIGLGVTRMSAGSRTGVGGYAKAEKSGEQFAIADASGVEDVKEMIRARGCHPVMKDWQTF
ncbi:MAG: 2-iminoacetate synthase ThiH [Elusimicrobia bacterium]|nr:2-iminoacetate synthase ThiH [Elusimicrobiota bacterium]